MFSMNSCEYIGQAQRKMLGRGPRDRDLEKDSSLEGKVATDV